MPTVNLELQLKFLNELEAALKDALERYSADGPEKLAELKFVQSEVDSARRVVAARLTEDAKPRVAPRSAGDAYGNEAVA